MLPKRPIMFQKGYFQHFRCFFGLQGAKDETISVELKSGIAEIFGNEMVLGTKYTFRSGAKFAVFTYYGCQILILDKIEVQPYTSKDTPMIM